MDGFIFLIFRRMRRPLLTLLTVYSVAVLGLVLIPGRDADGNLWHMSFFHAFYFVSYMGTTIGFGEIPYAFTDAQRIWVTFSIYGTVVAWLYAIGTVLTLFQDRTFQQSVRELRFARRIRKLVEPFFLLAGYGQTGRELVVALTRRGQHVVVIDRDQEPINRIHLENLPEVVPGLQGDARRPSYLLQAGLGHPQCAGVVALTDDNEVNLKVALTAKLLRSNIKVICRADSHDIEANMASFGTEHIIDPFDTFALHLATALDSPGLYLITEWLTGVSQSELKEPVYPPTEGVWIVCGYGRFGKAIYQRLKKQGLNIVVVEAKPDKTGVPDTRVVVGRGTEAETLQEAGLDNAVGLVAGTDDDTNNLSIIMTARDLKPGLFVVARQNHRDNQSLFDAVKAEIVMHPSAIIANRIRVLLTSPMLHAFLQLAKYEDEQWACQLISRIIAVLSTRVPDIWEVPIDASNATAVAKWLKSHGGVVTLGDLLRSPSDRTRQLPGIALMLQRDGSRSLLPDDQTRLKMGDRVLWCGRESARKRMAWALQNEHVLFHAVTGETRPEGTVMRWIAQRRKKVKNRVRS